MKTATYLQASFPISLELRRRLARIADRRGGIKMTRLYAAALAEWATAQEQAYAEEMRGPNGAAALTEDRPRGKS